VIVEAPRSTSGGDVLPLARSRHGRLHRRGLANGTAIGTCTPDKITMATGGKVKARPFVLTGGTAFTITWEHRLPDSQTSANRLANDRRVPRVARHAS